MYKIIIGNEIQEDTYDFIFDDYTEATNFIKTVIENGHQISMYQILEKE